MLEIIGFIALAYLVFKFAPAVETTETVSEVETA